MPLQTTAQSPSEGNVRGRSNGLVGLSNVRFEVAWPGDVSRDVGSTRAGSKTRPLAFPEAVSQCCMSPRGMFTNVPELEAAINDYVAHHKVDSRPFIWTESARSILRKVIRVDAPDCLISRLSGRPAPSPVNASTTPSWAPPRDSGPGWFAISFPVSNFDQRLSDSLLSREASGEPVLMLAVRAGTMVSTKDGGGHHGRISTGQTAAPRWA